METLKRLQERINSADNVTTIWDFIEFFYPDYQRSGDIAYNDDLLCVAQGEIGDSTDKQELFNRIKEDLKSELGYDPLDTEVQSEAGRLFELDTAEILERAVEQFLSELKTTKLN